MGGNSPDRNFPKGDFPGGSSVDGNFPDGTFPERFS